MSGLLYQLALTKIKSVGPVTARNIVSYCGSPEAVFRQSKKSLSKIPSIGLKTAEEILSGKVLPEAEKELEFILKNKIEHHFYLDKSYPTRLKNHSDSPVMLFSQGNIDFEHPRTLGIVGTRQPTEHGSLLCEKIIDDIKEFDISIISGLAYGIDAISHQTAIKNGMQTIGILGTGIDKTYPAIHRNLRNKMTAKGGVATEFTSGTGPDKENFPMRNRIIAGLSDAVLVIESGLKGGSMITAHMAFGYNKDVFAIPGRIHDPMSSGPNYLIKANIAGLIESATDLTEKMMWQKSKTAQPVQLQLFYDLTEDEQKILSIIREDDQQSPHVDTIQYISGFAHSKLTGIILGLECKNLIKSLPGSRFMLKI